MDLSIKEMIESIARELVKTWQEEKAPAPKVLFIFCDSHAHEPFMDQFIQLQNHGIHHDLLFLDGETSSWLGMSRIECGGAGKIIAADEYAPAPIEVPKDYDVIIVPEIDLDNAARVVTGLKGTIKAEIIFSALVLQKVVLIGEDVPGIKRIDRRTLKTLTLPTSYQKLFQRYLVEMREMGIEILAQRELVDCTIRKIREVRHTQERLVPKSVAETTVDFRGKYLSADWVRTHSFTEKIVRVHQGAIISPLALDVLREKSVKIQYIGKG